jgi:hypothetical protein
VIASLATAELITFGMYAARSTVLARSEASRRVDQADIHHAAPRQREVKRRPPAAAWMRHF